MEVNMDERFSRNIGAITQAEQELLLTKRAAIIGCGGLGCYSAEFMVRMGIGHLTLIDGDTFIASNLNRQLNSMAINIGKNKAAETKRILLMVRTDLSVDAVDVFLEEENAQELLKNHDVIIDALDNIKTRLLVEKTANSLGTPLVHGAVEQWNIQVCTVFPGDFTLSLLYQTNREPEKPSVLSFTPAFCASIQAAEAVKVLLNKERKKKKKLLTADLKANNYETIELS
jgi:molybdopterin/thiamine biosynthesis adenylyltransferase